MRLFVGVGLEDAVTAAASEAAQALKARLASIAPDFSARWVPQANLHITLWFLGEVDQARAENLINRLRDRFETARFTLGLQGCGAFPRSGPPRVLWIGTTAGTGEMRALYAELERRLVPLGYQAERRPYLPHLTIARVKDPGRGSARAVREVVAGMDADCGTSTVSAVTLFRSRLSPHGSAYEALLRVPLG